MDRRRGERKTLQTAAMYAAYTNFDATPETFTHKPKVLAGHCRDLGRDVTEITRSANFNVVIAATEAEVTDRLDWIAEHYRSVLPGQAERQRDTFASGPLVSTPEQIVEALRSLEQIGMTYAITYFAEAAYDTSGIELLRARSRPGPGRVCRVRAAAWPGEQGRRRAGGTFRLIAGRVGRRVAAKNAA